MKLRLLVTGATGFVGAALVRRLVSSRQFQVRAAVRSSSGEVPAASERIVVGGIGPDTDWARSLSGIDVVVHLAGRAHVLPDTNEDSMAAFNRVNAQGTLRLAQQAAQAGATRFIFLSTVKVYGDAGSYSENDAAQPAGGYGISKYQAEEGLRRIAAGSGMEFVIVRSPLVYGPGAKANFRMLVRAIKTGLPLPFGSIRNRRSFVALDNLVDFIVTCIVHPAAANEIFLVSDGEDLSTPDLVRRIGIAVNKPARLIPLPAKVLTVAAGLVGKRDIARRLVESLQVDSSKASQLLGWSAPLSVDQGLRLAVRGS
jgi:nucleoside-diphosphate-sugar epimerase